MPEIAIQSNDPKAQEQLDALMHQMHVKARTTQGWAAGLGRNADGGQTLVLTFPPLPMLPTPSPEDEV